MFVHRKIAQFRSARQLTRSDLHRQLVRRGLSCCRALIDRWETGKSEPTASQAWLLAQVLEVPIADLFDGTGAP